MFFFHSLEFLFQFRDTSDFLKIDDFRQLYWLSLRIFMFSHPHMERSTIKSWNTWTPDKSCNYPIIWSMWFYHTLMLPTDASSSIPSWHISTAHAQPFRGARDLAVCLKIPLDSLLVWASSEGSGETARMRRLAWTFAARIGDNYQIRLTRSNWYRGHVSKSCRRNSRQRSLHWLFSKTCLSIYLGSLCCLSIYLGSLCYLSHITRKPVWGFRPGKTRTGLRSHRS